MKTAATVFFVFIMIYVTVILGKHVLQDVSKMVAAKHETLNLIQGR